MRWGILALVAIGSIGPRPATAQIAHERIGIGVIGDSYSDEYAFYPPHRSRARNWVEILAAAGHLDFGTYSLVTRGEPRNEGFAHNWARSGATTSDMIAHAQHTGVAEQVARGEVALVCVFIGGNDFLEALRQPDPAAALDETPALAGANLETAVRAILDASPTVRILLATVPDLRELPELAGSGHDAAADGLHLALARAVSRYNSHVWSLAGRDSRIAVADLHLSTRLAQLVSPRSVHVGGRSISRAECGDGVDHVFLADRRHVGTVVQGLLARVLVAAINRHLDLAIELPTDEDLLEIATRAAEGSSELAGGAPPVSGPEIEARPAVAASR